MTSGKFSGLNIEYTPKALEELEDIRDYINQDSSVYADRVVNRIISSVRILSTFPLLGHEGRVPDTYEWIIAGLEFFVVYDIPNSTTLRILRVMHMRRKYP